jgi:RNA polymerase sigma-70 factor (ECF subfamily)
MDETALVSAAIKGDLDAFNRLVLAHQELAYNVACRILSDQHAAEDVTQTAFLSAYRNLNKFRGGSFRSWVLRIVTNACYDELRRRQRHPEMPLEPLDSESDGEFDNPSWMKDQNPGPEEVFDQRQLHQAVQRCLDDLAEDFKAVVVLVDIEGMDYQEVSLIINKPLGTIKSRLSRARFKLKDCLKSSWEQLPLGLRLEPEESV